MMHPSEQNHIVYLALGANLDDRRSHIASAIDRLHPHVSVTQLSSLYETEPAYVSEQPRFLNAALRGQTTLTALDLLHTLKSIEQELGRVRGPRFGPRVIDLDILLYDDIILDRPELTIPHPRMAERPFVLVPLAEIAPNLTPPGWSNSIAALARSVHGHGDIIALHGRLHPIQNT